MHAYPHQGAQKSAGSSDVVVAKVVKAVQNKHVGAAAPKEEKKPVAVAIAPAAVLVASAVPAPASTDDAAVAVAADNVKTLKANKVYTTPQDYEINSHSSIYYLYKMKMKKVSFFKFCFIDTSGVTCYP